MSPLTSTTHNSPKFCQNWHKELRLTWCATLLFKICIFLCSTRSRSESFRMQTRSLLQSSNHFRRLRLRYRRTLMHKCVSSCSCAWLCAKSRPVPLTLTLQACFNRYTRMCLPAAIKYSVTFLSRLLSRALALWCESLQLNTCVSFINQPLHPKTLFSTFASILIRRQRTQSSWFFLTTKAQFWGSMPSTLHKHIVLA